MAPTWTCTITESPLFRQQRVRQKPLRQRRSTVPNGVRIGEFHLQNACIHPYAAGREFLDDLGYAVKSFPPSTLHRPSIDTPSTLNDGEATGYRNGCASKQVGLPWELSKGSALVSTRKIHGSRKVPCNRINFPRRPPIALYSARKTPRQGKRPG